MRLTELAFVAAVFAAGGASPSAPAPSAAPIDTAAIDSLIRATMRSRGLVGLSIGIAQDGKIVFAKGYGARSTAPPTPVRLETMFAIGSVTKQFTCSALLLLAQEQKLSLDDRVAKYMPNLTRAGDITLLELGQHVSGYRDYYPLDFVDRTTLGDDFNAFLTPQLLASARATLARLGPITGLKVTNRVERGGMEVAVLEFKIGAVNTQALMYRTPDGKIQELLMGRQ